MQQPPLSGLPQAPPLLLPFFSLNKRCPNSASNTFCNLFCLLLYLAGTFDLVRNLRCLLDSSFHLQSFLCHVLWYRLRAPSVTQGITKDSVEPGLNKSTSTFTVRFLAEGQRETLFSSVCQNKSGKRCH